MLYIDRKLCSIFVSKINNICATYVLSYEKQIFHCVAVS